MQSKIQKWGNSQAIRLPKAILDIARLSENEQVQITAEPDTVIIKKVKIRRHMTLEERLKDWDGQPYELTDEDKEWLSMKPVGNEIW
jgi:antitoxin MazE